MLSPNLGEDITSDGTPVRSGAADHLTIVSAFRRTHWRQPGIAEGKTMAQGVLVANDGFNKVAALCRTSLHRECEDCAAREHGWHGAVT